MLPLEYDFLQRETEKLYSTQIKGEKCAESSWVYNRMRCGFSSESAHVMCVTASAVYLTDYVCKWVVAVREDNEILLLGCVQY